MQLNSSWHAYPKIFQLGHRAIEELFYDPVIVEEKIDGSQFSFAKIGGELLVKSKSATFPVDAPEAMFTEACKTVEELGDTLMEGWTYRAEFLKKPHHNGLSYNRIPAKHLIVFDINTDEEAYLPYNEKLVEATRIGLECVPVLDGGMIESPEKLLHLLEMDSILGGCHIEGVVVKNYHRFGTDKKVLMGKYVSEAFKETQKVHFRAANPTGGDIVDALITALRTPARWQKAVQHLREAGKLEGSPRDIGPLIKAIPDDVLEEEKDRIMHNLFGWAWPKIRRGLTYGLPEWYKQQLLEQQFNGEGSNSDSGPAESGEVNVVPASGLPDSKS